MGIILDLGEIELFPEDIWPDGDAPETIDADAVVAVMKNCGNLRRLLTDWNLHEAIDARVYVTAANPHYRGDNVLIPDLAPAPTVSTQARFK